jgi:molybdopterin-guanine dinucleotide biosynthesis protein A
MATKLEELILRDKLRRMKDLAEVFEIAVADWPVGPHDPFININTPQDLAAAESLLL